MSMHTIRTTDFHFSDAQQVYRGKVRDVYRIEDIIIMVATDRISAFDHILPEPIPYKGQVLNGIAAFFLESTKSIVPNWLKVVPHPNISAGIACQPLPVEMVIRGYLAGHAAREYRLGKRLICDVHLPEGLKEGDPLPHPIITPTTKATEGHDLDISRADILSRGIVSEAHYLTMEKYTYALFEKGTQMAADRGLLLVDTKYEFGLYNDEVILIDELHTPDSSRYYYSDGYEERQASGEPQKQLSKEFVREWLIQQGFQGKEGQQMPVMPEAFVDKISNRYIELYERITGTSFEKSDAPIDPRSVLSAVNSIQYAG